MKIVLVSEDTQIQNITIDTINNEYDLSTELF